MGEAAERVDEKALGDVIFKIVAMVGMAVELVAGAVETDDIAQATILVLVVQAGAIGEP